MKQFENILNSKAKIVADSIPQILSFKREGDRNKALQLFSSHAIRNVVDDYKEQLHELFAVKNPGLVYAPDFETRFESYFGGLEKKQPLWERGKWIFYPWLSTLVHILDDVDFQLVRTARNRNLINAEEQKKFYEAVIGIGGLSVGNSVALAIVLQGGGRHIRLADHDRLALTNINRVRAGVQNLGLRKVEITARQIYEINPYAKIELFPDGLTPKNIGAFFAGPPKLDIVIDEIDNLAMKYLIREQARKHRLAVVMAADNGDNAVVDVERYDVNPRTPFFHGRIGKTTYAELVGLDKFGIGKTITKHIGAENVTERMRESLLEMGKTIVSWPQLGGAATLNGAAVAYCVRKILNNQPIEHDRALLSLDEKLVPHYDSGANIRKRKKSAEAFKKIFGL